MLNTPENILSSAFKSKEAEVSKLEIIEPEHKNMWNEVEGLYFKHNKRQAASYYTKSIDEWIPKDFLKYFCDAFLKEVGQELNVSIATGSSDIKKVSDEFLKILGRTPSKQEMKDYLDWFMAEQVKPLISRYNSFKMSFLVKPWTIQKFADKHIIYQEKTPEIGINPKLKDASLLTKKAMQAVATSSRRNLVERYGLVLSTVWLMKIEGYTEDQAVNEVVAMASQIASDGGAALVIKSTARHNPYPIWCKFQSLDSMLVDLTRQTGEFFDVLSLSFHEGADTFSFLNIVGE